MVTLYVPAQSSVAKPYVLDSESDVNFIVPAKIYVSKGKIVRYKLQVNEEMHNDILLMMTRYHNFSSFDALTKRSTLRKEVEMHMSRLLEVWLHECVDYVRKYRKISDDSRVSVILDVNPFHHYLCGSEPDLDALRDHEYTIRYYPTDTEYEYADFLQSFGLSESL